MAVHAHANLNYSTKEDAPTGTSYQLAQAMQKANRGISEAANSQNAKVNLTSSDRAKLETVISRAVEDYNKAHPENKLKFGEPKFVDGKWQIGIEREVPALATVVPRKKAAAATPTYMSSSTSSYRAGEALFETASRKSIFGNVAIELQQETPYAVQFKVDAPTTAELSSFEIELLATRLLSDTGSAKTRLSDLSDEEKRQFAKDVREITITGSASMEIAKDPGKNDKEYSRQLEKNTEVAKERAKIGVGQLRDYLARQLGEGNANLITVVSSETPNIKYIRPDNFDHFIRDLCDKGAQTHGPASSGSIEGQQTSGAALVRKWLSEGVIRKNEHGNFELAKPAEFNRQIKQKALGGLRDESNPSDPLVQAFSPYRGIYASTKSPLGVEISIERAGASGTRAALPAEPGKPIVFKVSLYQLHHDKSKSVANETVRFEDVRVSVWEAGEMRELTKDKYSVDEKNRTITILKPIDGTRYIVQAAGVKYAAGAELQRTKDARAEVDVSLGYKPLPKARPREFEVPRPLSVSAPATSIVLKTEFLPEEAYLSYNFVGALSQRIGADAARELTELFTEANNAPNFPERQRILSEGISALRSQYGPQLEGLQQLLRQGYTVQQFLDALSRGSFSEAFGMSNNADILNAMQQIQVRETIASQLELLEFIRWSIRTGAGVSYSLGTLKVPGAGKEEIQLYVYYDSRTFRTTISDNPTLDYRKAGARLMTINAPTGIVLGGGVDYVATQGSKTYMVGWSADIAKTFALRGLDLTLSGFVSRAQTHLENVPVLKRDIAGAGAEATAPITRHLSFTASQDVFAPDFDVKKAVFSTMAGPRLKLGPTDWRAGIGTTYENADQLRDNLNRGDNLQYSVTVDIDLDKLFGGKKGSK